MKYRNIIVGFLVGIVPFCLDAIGIGLFRMADKHDQVYGYTGPASGTYLFLCSLIAIIIGSYTLFGGKTNWFTKTLVIISFPISLILLLFSLVTIFLHD
jgi:hypothetical protein